MINIFTQEYEKIRDLEIPLEEYPNPQFQRESYLNLNGTWEYTISKDKTLRGSFPNHIKVPFCLESAASTVEKMLEKDEYIIYHRTFNINKEFIKDFVFINFLGVDQSFELEINGHLLNEEISLCLPSKIDITKYIKEENEIYVIVKDNLEKQYPYGKQTKNPKGMFYTPVSGIYYPVYIESVSKEYIKSIKLTPSLNEINIFIDSDSNDIEIEIIENDNTIYHQKVSNEVNIRFSNPHNWSIEDPFLYKLIIRTHSDEIKSYFALRKIEMKDGFFYLNNKKTFLAGVLDQGYYPEGIFTPSTYDSYKNDILTMKELGFNMIRKHIKVELPYFYYLCDKYGMLVLQDFVNNGEYNFIRDTALPTIGLIKKNDANTKNTDNKVYFKKHLTLLQNYLFNHPSIIGYTIFNEGWGQFNSEEIHTLAFNNDPTRVYDTTSGWFHCGKTDFNSYHLYFSNINKLKRIKDYPIFLSEFGGFVYKDSEHSINKKVYGYHFCKSLIDLGNDLEKLFIQKLLPYKNNLSGFVYTQLSDVEAELNGLITYDRKKIKVDKNSFSSLINKFTE